MLSEPMTLYKLMILYMLKQVKFPLTNSNISDFFVSKEYKCGKYKQYLKI